MQILASSSRLVAIIRRMISGLLVIFFTLMMTAVLVQVAGRYIFNYSVAGAVEIATFTQIWMVLLGAGIAMRRGQHVAIDLLPAVLPLRFARMAILAAAIGSIAFLLVVIKGSFPLIRFGFMQSSSALLIPMWIIYLCLPLGAVYLIFETLAALVLKLKDPFATEQAPHQEGMS
ncbi:MULTISPECIES: TRAP transporter small permease [unclassified Aurantimonas]|uniref:TRAP transporter small permease n=1 Tax=unclassified Aurantimonas TaxID=2638230 RepID=UPI002E193BFB|nr:MULTISPECIES: TRAP transporter small permease [unclassified Aurantimonas]MEC5293117.1 TRAP transporter small permease [Aurantimonas sp. C2-3-R2]MEC5414186.1 TRAP transporter small permease [Aurantimonas sp. C2-4-R8]